MEIYDSLLKAVHDEYDTLRVLKKSAWGEVSLVRHRESGTRYIFRHFEGSSEVYQRTAGRLCWKSMCRATPWEKFWREEC